ncbi:MAG: hypothetical protein H7Y11_06165, partial [Armatimonadetes bacterium]|nr:hypothetical protein [Anaerolineae bacterium]
MPKSRPPQDFGLNQDQLYDPEALAYWQQFTPEEFVHLAYHELINKQGVVMGFMAMLHDDPLFSKLPLTENYT